MHVQEQQLPNMAKTPVAPPQERALDHTEWTSNFPLVDMGTAKLLSAPQGILKRNPPFSAGGEAGLGGLEQPSLSANLEFGPAMEQAASTGQTRMVHTMMPGLSRWIKAMPRSPADSGDDKGANVKDSNRPDASLTSLTALSNAASDIKFSAFEVGESSFPIETGVHLDVEHGMKAGGDGEEGSAAAKLAHHHSRSVSPLHQASLTSLMDAGSHEGGTVGVSESSIVSDVSQSRRPVFNGNGFPTVGASGRIDRSDDTASVPRSSSSKGTTDGGSTALPPTPIPPSFLRQWSPHGIPWLDLMETFLGCLLDCACEPLLQSLQERGLHEAERREKEEAESAGPLRKRRTTKRRPHHLFRRAHGFECGRPAHSGDGAQTAEKKVGIRAEMSVQTQQ